MCEVTLYGEIENRGVSDTRANPQGTKVVLPLVEDNLDPVVCPTLVWVCLALAWVCPTPVWVCPTLLWVCLTLVWVCPTLAWLDLTQRGHPFAGGEGGATAGGGQLGPGGALPVS